MLLVSERGAAPAAPLYTYKRAAGGHETEGFINKADPNAKHY